MPSAIPSPKPRILLADDHILVLEGLKALLKDRFDPVGVVNDGRALVEAAMELRPDVIITDISMPVMNGLEAIRRIRATDPRARCIVMTMHRDTQLAVDAFRAGACAYLLKISPGDELLEAIDEVLRGNTWVTPMLPKDAITIQMEAESGGVGRDALTPRQREVLQLVAEGRTMKEVAALLKISPRTAESHKYELMQSLGLQTTAELVQYAVKLRLIPE